MRNLTASVRRSDMERPSRSTILTAHDACIGTTVTISGSNSSCAQVCARCNASVHAGQHGRPKIQLDAGGIWYDRYQPEWRNLCKCTGWCSKRIICLLPNYTGIPDRLYSHCLCFTADVLPAQSYIHLQLPLLFVITNIHLFPSFFLPFLQI